MVYGIRKGGFAMTEMIDRKKLVCVILVKEEDNGALETQVEFTEYIDKQGWHKKREILKKLGENFLAPIGFAQ